MARRHVATLLLASLAVSALAILHAQGSGIPADLYSQLRWRYIGPEGNRVSAVAGVPGDPLVVLRRRGVRRHLQDRGRRRHLGAHLRRSAGLIDRRHRRRALGSEHGLGGHRRGLHPQPHLGRRGDLQVDRRREDAGPGWVSRRPGASARLSSHPAEAGRGAGLRAGARLRAAAGARRLPDDRRRQDLGARAVRRREHGLLGLTMDPRTRASSSRACGRSTSRRGGAKAAGLAAACSSRTTAERPGRGCSGRGLPDARRREDGRRHRAVEPEPRLRADRDRRRRAVEGQGDRPRPGVAIGRWRRELAGRELRPQLRWAGRTTTRTSSSRRTTRRDVLPDGLATACRSTAAQTLDGTQGGRSARAATTTTCGSIRPNPARDDRRPTTRASRFR